MSPKATSRKSPAGRREVDALEESPRRDLKRLGEDHDRWDAWRPDFTLHLGDGSRAGVYGAIDPPATSRVSCVDP
jgi:hypothetical protein